MSTLCPVAMGRLSGSLDHSWQYEERGAGGNMLQEIRECRRCGQRESRYVPTLDSSMHSVEDAEERGWLEWGEI